MVKNLDLTRKAKAQILNKYIRVNVRQRAFKFWFGQTSGFVLLAILNLTTQKNHPVVSLMRLSTTMAVPCLVSLNESI